MFVLKALQCKVKSHTTVDTLFPRTLNITERPISVPRTVYIRAFLHKEILLRLQHYNMKLVVQPQCKLIGV
jgi:hypothetical protein